VVSAPTRLAAGARVVVQTALGPQTFTVSGVLRTAAAPAFYALDPVAERLAGGRIDAIALTARPGYPAARLAAWANTRAMVVVLGLALVYTVIAIANTLVIATAGRRAELAALRLAGATRGQVLRLAGTEAAG
jgi:putative ABC transport system permease protein